MAAFAAVSFASTSDCTFAMAAFAAASFASTSDCTVAMAAVVFAKFVATVEVNVSIWICALERNVPIYCNSSLLTVPSANFAASIPVANFSLVTFASASFAVVTFASFILAVSTASLAKSPTTIVPSAIIELTTLLAPIVVTPVLSMVTSPLMITSCASPLASPR